MATATRKRTSKKNAQSPIVKLNAEALKTTEELIDGTVETGAKWQNLYAKSLKKSEPIISKNINIAFDTVETVVDQYQKSSKRVLALFGWDVKEVKKATQKAVSTARKATKPATKRASSIAKKASTTAAKATNTAKKAVSAIKVEAKTTTKPVAKNVKKTATKTVATAKAKVQTTASTVVSKAKKTTIAKKAVATVQKSAPKATAASKKVIKKVASKIDTSNLTLINGVGPKMEALLKKEGYPNLEAISNATVADLKKVLDNAGARYRLLNPQSWVADAKKALK